MEAEIVLRIFGLNVRGSWRDDIGGGTFWVRNGVSKIDAGEPT